MKKKLKKIYIEISNICNLSCSFCPPVERTQNVLPETNFRKILSQAAPLAEELALHVMGEPLGHPEFPRFVQVASEYGTPINITTNGTLLSENNTNALLQPIVRQVNFSLQAFQDNFPGSNPETYWLKLLQFVRKAEELRPDLYINFRLWNLQETSGEDQENERFLSFLEKNLGIEISRGIELSLRKSKRLVGRLYLHYDSRFVWPSEKDPVRQTEGFCHALSQHVAIQADGAVVPCCLDKEAKLKLGNCLESSLDDVLAGSRATLMRNGFARGALQEDLCKRCDYIQRFSGKAKRLANSASSQHSK